MPSTTVSSNSNYNRKGIKLLTREARKVLLEWFFQHQNYAYPSEVDKIHFVKTLNVTRTQINNFFQNMRRRKTPNEYNTNTIGPQTFARKKWKYPVKNLRTWANCTNNGITESPYNQIEEDNTILSNETSESSIGTDEIDDINFNVLKELRAEVDSTEILCKDVIESSKEEEVMMMLNNNDVLLTTALQAKKEELTNMMAKASTQISRLQTTLCKIPERLERLNVPLQRFTVNTPIFYDRSENNMYNNQMMYEYNLNIDINQYLM
jgi:hypothetical protein